MKINLKYRAYWIFFITYIISIVWLIGFIVFLSNLPHDDCNLNEAEALIILTGGKNRIEQGFKVFSQSNVAKLLVSGVGKNISHMHFTKLANKNNIDKNKIILGHLASTTVENAIETKAFIKLWGYKNICIITSNYHIPRSEMIFKDIITNINIGTISISPNYYNNYWAKNIPNLGIAFIEYNKLNLKFINLIFINNMKIVDKFLYNHLIVLSDYTKNLNTMF